MAYKFTIEPQALKRRFSVYVVVAKDGTGIKLYVGKTGDNREGCNPIISRCGNHFSYNKIHSQVRNKLEAHEDWSYTYVFDHFDDYTDDKSSRRKCIDCINEMERWLNQLIQDAVKEMNNVEVLNPFLSRGWVSKEEKEKRNAFHTNLAEKKIRGIVDEVCQVIRNHR